MSFYVLPDFVIHQSHPYDEEIRKSEVRALFKGVLSPHSAPGKRKYNKQLYVDFREETCLRWGPSTPERVKDSHAVHRYLHFSLAMGELDTVKGVNLQIECQKVPGVSGLAVDVSVAGSGRDKDLTRPLYIDDQCIGEVIRIYGLLDRSSARRRARVGSPASSRRNLH